MNSIVTQIIIVFISVIVGGLFAYFISSLTQRKVFKSIAIELTKHHEQIYHKVSVEKQLKELRLVFEKDLGNHEDKCIAAKDIGKLKTGMIWLVSQAGGNPSDLGLN